jgi:hypothetical protein
VIACDCDCGDGEDGCGEPDGVPPDSALWKRWRLSSRRGAYGDCGRSSGAQEKLGRVGSDGEGMVRMTLATQYVVVLRNISLTIENRENNRQPSSQQSKKQVHHRNQNLQF